MKTSIKGGRRRVMPLPPRVVAYNRLKRALDVFGAIFGVLGALAVGKYFVLAMYLFIIGSTSHGILGYKTKNYGLMSVCVVFVLIDIFWILNRSL
mgnify:CR=1 FL=1